MSRSSGRGRRQQRKFKQKLRDQAHPLVIQQPGTPARDADEAQDTEHCVAAQPDQARRLGAIRDALEAWETDRIYPHDVDDVDYWDGEDDYRHG